MNKLLKVFTICLIIVLLASFIVPTIASAASTGFDWGGAVGEFATAEGNKEANEATKNIVGAFATIVKIVGVGVAVIMLIVLAMKYMLAAPGDKAEIKKHAVVYVVGAVILFAATQIIGIIADFAVDNIKMSA